MDSPQSSVPASAMLQLRGTGPRNSSGRKKEPTCPIEADSKVCRSPRPSIGSNKYHLLKSAVPGHPPDPDLEVFTRAQGQAASRHSSGRSVSWHPASSHLDDWLLSCYPPSQILSGKLSWLPQRIVKHVSCHHSVRASQNQQATLILGLAEFPRC